MEFAFLVHHWQDLGFAPDCGCRQEEAEGESLRSVKAPGIAVGFPLWHVPGMREESRTERFLPWKVFVGFF